MGKSVIEGAEAQVKEKKRKRRRKIIRRIITLILVLALFAAGGLYLYSGLKAEYTVNYKSYTAQTGTISNSLSFSGTLAAIDNKTYTASSSTTVRNVYVKEGDDVKEGDRLIKLANGQTLTAGFDGRVNQVYAAEGDSVANGDSLVQVVDFTNMKVSIRVDEYNILDVSRGDACRITTTATEKTFESTISSISYISSSGGSVAYYTAIAYVKVDEGTYPGMQVTVTVPKEEVKDVVILKEDALSFDSTNRAFVYTMNADGTMETTYVSTGVSNGNYVEITGGIKSGDVVYVVDNTAAESSSGGLLGSLLGGISVSGSGSTGGAPSRSSSNGGFGGGMDFSGFSGAGGFSGGGR